MGKTYCLRAASAERLDFFEAEFVMNKSGIPEIRGGNVRQPYLPSEVWLVKPGGFDRVRGFVRDFEAAMRALMRMDEVDYARRRDDLSTSMTHNLSSILSEHCRPVVPEDFGAK